MGSAVIAERTIHYHTVDSRTARPWRKVLYVHGTGCNGQVWVPHMTAIADAHMPVAIDLPGHGLSPGRGFRGPGLQQGGRYFAQKYQHSPYAEEHARGTIERILTILKHALEGRQYLVGEAFSRADVTTACMLMLVNPAPDDLFLFPAGMRPMYTVSRTLDAAFAPIFAWRDEMYRKYRGEAVKP